MPAIAGHRLLPHKVNQRANILALKRTGATTVLGFSALRCLAQAVEPGHMAMSEQYFDRTPGSRVGKPVRPALGSPRGHSRWTSASLTRWGHAGAVF